MSTTTTKEETIGKIIAKVITELYNHVANCIILKVQDDLQYLRAAANAGESSVDVKTLDMVLNRTEQGIQAIAERVVHSTHDQITTLPTVAQRGHSKDTSSINSHPHPRDHKKHRFIIN